MPIRLAVAGAAGRMGRRIIALASADPEARVVLALEGPGHAEIGRDAGELAGIGNIDLNVTESLTTPALLTPSDLFDVMIDFSTPAGTIEWLKVCCRTCRPIVIGTTGHDEAALKKIIDAASVIPVFKSANMSVGVNVILRLTREVGALLDESYDIEMIESHHRFKVDAPSGTALAILAAIQQGRREAGRSEGQSSMTHGSQSGKEAGPRIPGDIGIHSLRIGDTVGEHTIQFGNLGETISLSHSAHSRDTFATGALRAAKWISGRSAGLFDMQDVLFGTSP